MSMSDKHIEYIKNNFDIKGNETTIPNLSNFKLPINNWNIGVVFGHSGSGKTTLLKELGYNENETILFNNDSVISNIDEDPEKASELLSAVGLNSIPTWMNSYQNLSNGEKYRAKLAKLLSTKKDIYLVDEYTSVIDRNAAKSMSNAIYKYIKKNNIKIILVACHSDIIEWLNPCWIFDCNDKKFKKKSKNQKYIYRYTDVEMRLGNTLKNITI